MMVGNPFASKPLFAVVVAAVLLTAAPSAALAGDSAAADALFNEAKVLVDAKKYAEACPKFEASYRLDKAVGTLMNLADCHEHVGRVASAWGEWGEAFDWLKRESDKRAPFARSRRDELAPRLPKLTINVTGVKSRLQVFRDSTLIEEGAYNASLPTDPGPHELTVRRGDEVLKQERVELKERDNASVSFDLEAIEKAAPPPKAGAGAVGQPVVLSQQSSQKTMGFVVGGIGLAAVLVAGALELGAIGSLSAVDDPGGCVNKLCSPDGFAAIERAGGLADAGQWVGIVGILAAGVGLTMVLTAPPPTLSSPTQLPDTRARRRVDAPRAAAVVAPWIGPFGGGISVAGRL